MARTVSALPTETVSHPAPSVTIMTGIQSVEFIFVLKLALSDWGAEVVGMPPIMFRRRQLVRSTPLPLNHRNTSTTHAERI